MSDVHASEAGFLADSADVLLKAKLSHLEGEAEKHTTTIEALQIRLVEIADEKASTQEALIAYQKHQKKVRAATETPPASDADAVQEPLAPPASEETEPVSTSDLKYALRSGLAPEKVAQRDLIQAVTIELAKANNGDITVPVVADALMEREIGNFNKRLPDGTNNPDRTAITSAFYELTDRGILDKTTEKVKSIHAGAPSVLYRLTERESETQESDSTVGFSQ